MRMSRYNTNGSLYIYNQEYTYIRENKLRREKENINEIIIKINELSIDGRQQRYRLYKINDQRLLKGYRTYAEQIRS